VLGVACLLLGACSSKPVADGGPDARDEQDEQQPDVRALADNPPPIEFEIRRGEYDAALPDTLGTSATGIETLAWTTAVPPLLFGEFLDGLVADLPAPDDETANELRRWEASGFRAIVLPADRLGLLVTGLTPVGSLNHRAWGVVPTWQPLHAASGSARRLATASGPVDVPAGVTPRLLVRAWTEPEIESGRLTDLIRVELVPQLYEPPTLAIDQPARLFAPIEQGRALAGQSLTLALQPGRCLVLTATGPAEAPAEGSGPPVPGAPSLGAALLAPDTLDPGRSARPVESTLIVIVPVVRSGSGGGGGGGGGGGR